MISVLGGSSPDMIGSGETTGVIDGNSRDIVVIYTATGSDRMRD